MTPKPKQTIKSRRVCQFLIVLSNKPITRYLANGMAPMRYRYDFGDNWQHIVESEDLLPPSAGAYPRCVAGAGACPLRGERWRMAFDDE